MIKRNYDRIGDTLYHEVLENGLNIFAVPKRGYSKSYAFFATNYGGIDMSYKLGGAATNSPEGVAHFLEHKMFDMEGENVLQTLTSLGASPNAFTSLDMTGYYFETTLNFAKCLDILLNFVSTPYFTPESVEKEQGIIAQEIRMYDDHPEHNCSMGLYQALYNNHPARVPIAGTVESIAEITAETLYACHDAFYKPSNMVLCVVGDLDPEQVVEAAKRMLPGTSGQTAEYELGAPEPEAKCKSYTERSMEVASPIFYAGYKCRPPAEGTGALLAEYTANIAADAIMGSSSPLYAELYAEGLIDPDFSFGYDSCRGAAMLVFGGKSRDPKEVVERVSQRVRDVAENGLDPAYFERRRKSAYGKMIRLFNSLEGICIGQASCFFNKTSLFELPDVFDSIDMAAVLAFISDNFAAEKLALSVINPK